ncbi:MAG: CDP-alcohol phosphatidyltransferase family protein [Deltaproteobacteria bacterium]|nr:CDP-alcohol phosphatidyltransferase family protein [Deltaproteobacteria bacterium]
MESFDGDKRLLEMRTNLCGYLVFRQLSFLITPLFAARFSSPTHVTLASLSVALAMPLVPWFGIPSAFWLVAILSFLSQLLDFVDGDLARVQRSTSAIGKYLDSFTGIMYWTALYVSVGIMVDADPRSGGIVYGYGLPIGLVTAIVDMLGKCMRQYVGLNFPSQEGVILGRSIGTKALFLSALASAIKLNPFLIVVCGLWQRLDAALLALLAFSLGAFTYSQLKIFPFLRLTDAKAKVGASPLAERFPGQETTVSA